MAHYNPVNPPFDKDDLEEFVNRHLLSHDPSAPLTEESLSLDQLRVKLIREVGAKPNETDNLFLEKFWSQQILSIWLRNNVENFEKKISQCHNIDTFRSLLEQLKNTEFWKIGKKKKTVLLNGIVHIPELSAIAFYELGISENSVLWEVMSPHRHAFTDEAIKSCLESYRHQCTSSLMDRNESIRTELRFFDLFIQYLKESADRVFIEKYRPLVFDGGQTAGAKFKKITEIISEPNKFPTLAETASSLKSLESYYLADEFITSVGRFFEPTKRRIFEADGIRILEVTGCFLQISELLGEKNIQECHLISHISVELNADFVQPGMNLVIKTSKLLIPAERIIDVSGKNAEKRHTSDAGMDSRGNGHNGKDGYAGESGGNVNIGADDIDNMSNLTIISNGGNGSDGQNGGNAKDGVDGNSLSTYELKEKLKPVSKFIGIRDKCILTILNYINENLDHIVFAWWTSIDGSTYDETWQNILNRRAKGFFGGDTTTSYGKQSMLVKAQLRSGILVTFASECGGFGSNCQSYLLVEGTNGTMGGDGGRAGRGGQPGFGGSIQVNQGTMSTYPGTAGSNGKGGRNGVHGRNGCDVGWMDYSVSGFFTNDWPEYFGESRSIKLSLVYYENNNSDRVLCPYRYNSPNSKSPYVRIDRNTLVQPKSRELNTTHEKTSSLEHQAIATRKNNVEMNSVRQLTSDLLSSTERTIASLKETLARTVEMVSALRNQLEEEEQQSKDVQIQITRSVEFQAQEKRDYDALKNEVADAAEALKITKPIALSHGNYQRKLACKAYEVLARIQWTPKLLNLQFPNERCLEMVPGCAFITKSEVPEVALSGSLKRYISFMRSNQKNLKKNFEFVDIKNPERCKKIQNAVIKAFVLDPSTDATKFGKLREAYKKWDRFKDMGWIVFEEPLKKLDKKAREDSALLKKVKENLELDCIPPTKAQIEMFAQEEEVAIIVYNSISTKPKHQFNESVLQRDYADEKVLRVCIDDIGEIHQMKTDDLRYELELHRFQKSAVFTLISEQLRSVLSLKQLDSYVKNKKMHEKKPIPASDEEFRLPKKFDCAKAIRCIRHYVRDHSGDVLGRLNLLTSPYIGTDEILRALRDRIAVEGGMVTAQDIAVLINTTLSLSDESQSFAGVMQWIIGANQQQHWIIECIIVLLENHFKRRLKFEVHVRLKLRSLKNREVLLLLVEQINKLENLDLDAVSSIICSLDSAMSASELRELDLDEWPFVLNLEYWMSRLRKCTSLAVTELERISFYLPTIEEVFTKTMLEEFMNVLDIKKAHLKAAVVVRMFQALYREECVLDEEFLSKLKITPTSLWEEKLVVCSARERTLEEIVALMKISARNNPKTVERIDSAHDLIKKSTVDYDVLFTKDQISAWSKKYKKRDIQMKETLAVINSAIYSIHGFYLRSTQKLAIVMFLLGSDDIGNRILEQVSTGEGKSLIVAAVAIVKSLRKEKVDVITSSTVLAKRDAEENAPLYNLFNILVGHNCSESVEERTEAYSSCNIVFGEITNFQRDYLLDRFYGRNILGNRNFENVIVDEVDSMLLDKGNHVLYLSHQIAGFDKLEAVFIYIWQLINKPAKNQEHFNRCMDTQRLKENVTDNLYKRITKDDLSLLSTPELQLETTRVWKDMQGMGLIEENGKLKKTSYNQADVNKLKSITNEQTRRRLLFLLRECSRKQCQAVVPNFLLEFVEHHLERWIENAKAALLMLPGNDYVVDVDRTGQRNELNPNIVILDRDTGTDQASSQWEEGLHQFLQLKHGCRLSLMSLKAVFISNVSFFKFYKNLFGMTGTLGSPVEMSLLREIHSVEYLTVPTARGKRFEEEKPIICQNEHAWTQAITKEVNVYTEKNNRSVLVICETIESVNFIQTKLEASCSAKISAYRREHEEFDIAKSPLEPGHVIIATNLAGRGTDIKISDKLRAAGGLHICLTYLPSNKRVEEQAFGRAARSGDPGSGRLIIDCDMKSDASGMRILKLRKRRDLDEIKRVSEIKEHYESKILAEEECFRGFHKMYDGLRSNFKDQKSADALNFLHNAIDKWALWLDKWKTFIELKNQDSSKKFREKLAGFVKEHSTYPVQGTSLTVPHGIKCGLMSLSSNNFKNALAWFDHIITREPDFCEAALYYKALVLAKQFNWEVYSKDSGNVKEVRRQLLIARRKFEKLSNTAHQYSAIITRLQDNFKQSGILQINAYEEQKKQFCEMYSYFISSIDDALGQSVTEDSFTYGIVDGTMSRMIHDELMKTKALTRMGITEKLEDNLLQEICFQYGLLIEVLKKTLQSLSNSSFEENKLMEQLEKRVSLPSRDEFWSELVRLGLLRELQTYVVLDHNKIVEEYPTVFENIIDQYKVQDTNEKSLKYHLETSKTYISKTIEVYQQLDDTKIAMPRDDFIKMLDKLPYDTLLEKNLISEMEIGRWTSPIEAVKFTKYDRLQETDFASEDIQKDDVALILKALIESKVIAIADSGYWLCTPALNLDALQLPGALCVYDYSVRSVLQNCFAYRIAFNRVRQQRRRLAC